MVAATKTKGLTVAEAFRLINSTEEFPRAVSRDRLSRWMKNAAADSIDVGRFAGDNLKRWFQLENAGRFDRSAYESDKAEKKRKEKRDLGELPTVKDPELRARCDAILWEFATYCFPELFYLEHSPDHLVLCEAIQSTIEKGGKRAIACQRGFGKTVWCTLGVLWAALTGRVGMIMLISGNDTEAANIAEGIVTALENNEKLYQVYPEICHCFRFMRDLGSQAKPLYQGKPIRLKQKPDVVFPALPGVPGSECCIRVCGIDSRRIRGAHHRTTTGKHVRPEIVLLDDPQDDEFANRPGDIDKREKKIKKAIHGVAGPGKRVAILMPCTVIQKNDLADRFLNRSQTPEYQGIRFPALDKFPDVFDDDENDLWSQYFEQLENDFLIGDEEHTGATEFYKANRKQMSRGAVVRWPARIEGFCVDALQTLMNIYAADRAAFMSEYQQDPDDAEAATNYLDENEISERFNGLKIRRVPDIVSTVTAGIDVQQRILYWMVIGWSDDLRGFICDFGTFPRQRSPQFTHKNAPYTIEDYVRKKNPLQRVKWIEALEIAIRDCVEQHIRPAVERMDGEPIFCSNCHIDHAWNKSRDAVVEVCQSEDFRDIMQPDVGVPVGGNDNPISQRKMPQGSRRPSPDVEFYFKYVPHSPEVLYHDANFYRSQFQQGLAADPGTPGSITFFGKHPNTTLANHFSAKWVEVHSGTKQTVEVWKNKVGRDQDHWLDTGVMSRVAVEVLGFRNTGPKGRNAKSKGGNVEKIDPAALAAARARARRSRS